MKDKNIKEKTDIPEFKFRHGVDPESDAWHAAFFIENHLDHFSYPGQVASPEQVGFMVYTEGEDRYYPCSDMMFQTIMARQHSDYVQQYYHDVLNRILDLIDKRIESKSQNRFLKSLIRIKFRHETRDQLMIPSRLEKRLFRIFLNRTLIEDPYHEIKQQRNRFACQVLNSRSLNDALNYIDLSEIKNPPTNLSEVREKLEHIEFKRFLSLSVEKSLWEDDSAEQLDKERFLKIFDRKMAGNGVRELFRFLGIRGHDTSSESRGRKILWIANEAGEIIMDLAIIKYLVKLGHKVIISFKEGPWYSKVDWYDIQEDEVLSRELEDAFLIENANLQKNDLVEILTRDKKIYVISDGTRENLNLLLASTTFARVFKEVDAVISRGEEQKRRFFENRFQFTQDIFNISSGSGDEILVDYKPIHPSVIKFSYLDLEKKAKEIIDRMKDARKNGMSVMFYSGVIGSIPGKIDEAKQIMTVFIAFLEEQLAETFIINPSRYYEPGMDADDLMYMWEIVQRSGYIDIWRFQTYEDISQAFSIMDRKVPPEWVGKDATYSTGCTKEMKIAMSVLEKHPEMQIIGPSEKKFMRRKDYGVGMMHDKRLV